MKKVCISTYCEWSSYGSVLQALALKKTLRDLECESFIVRDAPAPKAQKKFPLKLSKNSKTMVKQILSAPINKQKEVMYQKSVAFINRYMDMVYYNDYSALQKRIPDADYYMAGSDQIWHPALCKPAFFLDFLPDDVPRLSYAASMGVTQISKEKESIFSRLVSRFDTVSVREEEVESAVKTYTNKPIYRHIDPTFLVEAKDWCAITKPYPIQSPYILVYAIYWDKEFNKVLKKLHKETGYTIVALCPSGRSSVWANQKIYDADPGEFLYLIEHAEAVISSSFHGVALSLICNKKVAAVINPESPSRISSLLHLLEAPLVDMAHVMEFDLAVYKRINERISAEKQRSIDYLKEMLV